MTNIRNIVLENGNNNKRKLVFERIYIHEEHLNNQKENETIEKNHYLLNVKENHLQLIKRKYTSKIKRT